VLLVYPGPGPQPAVELIAQAQNRIQLNTYELTSDSVKHAIVKAIHKGVSVRIILEGSPYRGKSIARKEFRWCKRVKVDCKRAPKRFRYDHAKYFVVDGTTAWIGTMNFTWHGLNKNREAAYVTQRPKIVAAASAVFHADWTGKRASAGARKVLMLSPKAVKTLSRLLSRKGPVRIETEELGHMRRITPKLKALGKRLKLILPTGLSDYDKRNACKLAAAGAKVRVLASPRPHIKMVLTPKRVFIGSQNMSYTSLNKNREMGLVLVPPSGGGVLGKTFTHDWRAARALRCKARH
jgi:phosphatidylserine/phosphatidylglycerophosphate/cardiolipin synthase-like enzyme